MKSFLILSFSFVLFQTAVWAQATPASSRSESEILHILQASAEQHELLWYDDVISPNSVIMVGWIVNGEDLQASCQRKSANEEICNVVSQVMLHTTTARGNYLVPKEVQFRLVNGVVTGGISMLQ